jgi:4-amino-4-deoxy-L-arabinose transferase-like glycosyltransferase
MARHALHGEFSAFYWLNLYGGSQESLIAAAVFAVVGSSTLALKLVTLALFALSGILVWRVGVRTVGEPAARVGAAVYWICPAYFVWWSTKARAFYGFGTLCTLLAMLLVLRLRERDSRLDAAGLGLVLGLGFWATPEIVVPVLPALAWLAWRRPRAFRLAPVALPGLIAGASPWLVWNLRNDWKALFPASVAGAHSTYLGRLGGFFRDVLPTWLGLRVPLSLEWLPSRPVGLLILAVVFVWLAVMLVRRPRPLELWLAIAVALPFLYALSRFAYYVAEPRYLVLLSPVPALLLGWVGVRNRLGPVVLAAAAGLSVAGLAKLESQGRFAPHAPDVRMSTNLGPLVNLLERECADRVLANYWVAYPITFESRERVVATSTGFVRYVPHDRLVRSSPHPARVFVAGTAAESLARPTLEARGYRRLVVPGFVAYVHSSRAGACARSGGGDD